MSGSGRGDDHVARSGFQALAVDGPAHPARAHDDDVVLRRVVGMRLLHLAHRVRDEMDLDVVEPHAFVLVRRPSEAAVVVLVGDLDHR